ncbi:unnamed protein product [Adineta steineri]|uniref:Uncharacterized protein n=1 Tax=Adineta steineri TaxID=433720 RepID=A0A814TU80_9BILA|nr:unnamed protein product [Adineta steineri]
MDYIEDEYLTNLSWLKVSNSNELQSTVKCSNNYIDDDLQCLCWVVKMKPNSYSSHSLKRLSSTTNKNIHSDRSLTTTIDTRNTNNSTTSRRILMVRTLNNHLSPIKPSQQSFILIRSSNGKISCLSIRHFGYKSYKIEFVKCKQDGKIITKEKIKQRQLNESKLRFTRFYRTDNGSYVPDTTTIIYSDQMKEDYGPFCVKDVFPLYGPLRSHQKVCIETKGPPSQDFKNSFLINIIINDMNWSYQIEEFNKNGNIVTFYMPVPPNLPMNHIEATINIGYEQNVIYQANYLYISGLDEVLASKTSNESDERAAVNFSSSNNSSTSSSMEMNSGNRSRKRTRI